MKKAILLFVLVVLAAGSRLDAQCMASFTWSQTVNNQIDFISNSQNFTLGSTVYYWNYGDNNSGWSNASNTISHTYQYPGSYLVCMTLYDSATQCSGTFCDSVTVFGNPISSSCNASFAVYLDSVNTNQAWIYDQSTASSTAQYLWLWGDNTSDTTHYASHVYTSTGSYNICLVLQDTASFCTDTSCQLIVVARYSQQAQSVPFYVNVVSGGPLGIAQTAPAGFGLYPNPAQNELIIRTTNSPAGISCRITDISGRTVYAAKLDGNRIDISTLDKGMYVLMLENSDGSFSSQKFVKQ